MTDSQVVIVTGGAYGIGREIARLFVSRGASVVIADLNRERGHHLEAELLQQGKALFVPTDLREEKSIEELIRTTIAEFGRIDTLVNNAGVERYKDTEAMDESDWSFIVDTNLRGAFLCSKYAQPHLKASSGSIVFISSVQAFANEPQSSVYAATKAGLLGLTRSMAIDFATHGIRVNAVCPGAIHTGMTEVYLEGQSDPESVLKAIGAKVPLGRIGTPADIAPTVAFLASRDAAYITGSSIVVDGGLLCRLAL